MVEDSKTRVVLAEQQVRMQEYIPIEIPEWLIEPYEKLTASCTGDAVTGEEAAAPTEG